MEPGSWEGPCRTCGHDGSSALTLAYRGRPVGGLCPACARDPARVRAFVGVAEAFRRGVDPDASRDAVRIHRREGLREALPPGRFAQLVPRALRAPWQGQALPPPARGANAGGWQLGVAEPPPEAHKRAQGLWWRLRRAWRRG